MNRTGNTAQLKTIEKILNANFFIPAYQRGYRWDPQQVEDLLNDIFEFTPKEIKDSEEMTWYSLQPLVVKECDTLTLSKHNLDTTKKWYEVIDGQQRLTTVYLVVHYINEMLKGREKIPEPTIKYQTRPKSEDFLKNLCVSGDNDEVLVNEENIDFFHMSRAYKRIRDWFKDKGNFDTGRFESKLIFSTRVIWYETTDPDSIEIFTRINIGKIPLTDAELIKALFLNSSNFKSADAEKVRLKQLEIASEWDRIEYSLHDKAFWYFLSNNQNPPPARINFIMDLMARKPKESDDHWTFRFFNQKFKKGTEKEIADNWQEIKKYFLTLEEWFTDRVLYHKTGYLLATGEEISQLITLKSGITKELFTKELNTLIAQRIEEPENLTYKDKRVRNVLLLHNIQTMLDNEDVTYRFPFDRYKVENWDVEHVTAIAEGKPTSEEHQKEWLSEASKYIDSKELRQKVENYSNESFDQVYDEILNYFSEENKHEDINDVSNLVLLSASINRSYKNAVFPVKRNTIIENEVEGTFVPICTKNVFMKFYSKNVHQMTFWGKDDRDAYVKDLKATLKTYMNE